MFIYYIFIKKLFNFYLFIDYVDCYKNKIEIYKIKPKSK